MPSCASPTGADRASGHDTEDPDCSLGIQADMADALVALMGAISHLPGTWFWLRDDDTQFSQNHGRHPFVLPDGFDPGGRRALAHGLPRSSQEPRSGRRDVDYLIHGSHGVCNGKPCDLDRTGWIKPLRYQVTSSWLSAGSFICVEPSRQVLGRIQTFEMEAAKDA